MKHYGMLFSDTQKSSLGEDTKRIAVEFIQRLVLLEKLIIA